MTFRLNVPKTRTFSQPWNTFDITADLDFFNQSTSMPAVRSSEPNYGGFRCVIHNEPLIVRKAASIPKSDPSDAKASELPRKRIFTTSRLCLIEFLVIKQGDIWKFAPRCAVEVNKAVYTTSFTVETSVFFSLLNLDRQSFHHVISTFSHTHHVSWAASKAPA